jgi:predicted aminopeptidase
MRPSASRSSSPDAPAAHTSAMARSARAGVSSIRTQAKALVWALLLMALPGCYLAHLAGGQLRLLRARRPIPAVLADPATPAAVRDVLALVPDVRRFAAQLGLAVDDEYRTYVSWPGDRVVTALVATEPREVDPAGFWFPLVGTVPYKGFFDEARAARAAASLVARGYDTCLVPVPAYSTLGWFDDPVVQPMLRGGRGPFVEMLLHELTHATVFVESDADFNESVATFVGEEGAVRFFATRGEPEAAARERARVRDDRAVAAVLRTLRERLAALYAAHPARSGSAAGAAEVATARAGLEREARDALRALPLTTRSPARLADEIPLHPACLALAGTYERDLPLWDRRLSSLGGDLAAFVAAARAAQDADDPRAALAGPAASEPSVGGTDPPGRAPSGTATRGGDAALPQPTGR